MEKKGQIDNTPKNKFGHYLYKYVSDGKIIYIGITNNIVKRVQQHASDKGLDKKFTPYIKKSTIFVHECSTKGELKALERLLIDMIKPILNVKGKTDIAPTISFSEKDISWKLYNKSDYISQVKSEETKAKRMQNNARKNLKMTKMADENNKIFEYFFNHIKTCLEHNDYSLTYCNHYKKDLAKILLPDNLPHASTAQSIIDGKFCGIGLSGYYMYSEDNHTYYCISPDYLENKEDEIVTIRDCIEANRKYLHSLTG